MKIKTRRYYIYYLLRAGVFLLSILPLKVTLIIAEQLGKAAFRFLGKYRDIAVKNLEAAFGTGNINSFNTAEQVFINLACNGAEWIKLYSMPVKGLDRIVTGFDGADNLDRVISEGKGALVLGFHFGNWELLGLYLRHRGYPGKLVGRRIYFHKYDELLVKMRDRFDAGTIYRDESPRKMLKELKKGNILGIVPDQDVDSIDGIFVDFFGKPAFTPTAPVKLAMAAKTSIVPIFVVRQPDGTHRLVAEKPIDVSSGSGSAEDVRRYTQEWTSILEKYARKYPEQWVWIHQRWKTGINTREMEPEEVKR